MLQTMFLLQLSNVVLESSSKSREFAAALQRAPLRFSFQDGRVESVCSREDEDAWVLNIKRGILSAFQNSMTTFNADQTLQEVRSKRICFTFNGVI